VTGVQTCALPILSYLVNFSTERIFTIFDVLYMQSFTDVSKFTMAWSHVSLTWTKVLSQDLCSCEKSLGSQNKAFLLRRGQVQSHYAQVSS